MNENTFELIKIGLNFILNITVLGIGLLLARFTVNHYQKIKDQNLIKNQLIEQYSDTISKFEVLEVKLLALEKIFLVKQDENKYSLPDSQKLKRIVEQSKNINIGVIDIDIRKLEVSSNILFARMDLQLELSLEDKTKILKLRKCLLTHFRYWRIYFNLIINPDFYFEKDKVYDSLLELGVDIENYSENLNGIYTFFHHIFVLIFFRKVDFQKNLDPEYSIFQENS